MAILKKSFAFAVIAAVGLGAIMLIKRFVPGAAGVAAKAGV